MSAMWQIIKYGIAYIFCRIQRSRLPVSSRPLMQARHVALEVLGPWQFFREYDEREHFGFVSDCLSEFVRVKTNGALSMSLTARSFPKDFDEVPFSDGLEVKEKCSTNELTKEGRIVRDAFEGAVPAWQEPTA